MLVKVKAIKPIYGVCNTPIRSEVKVELNEIQIRRCLINGRVFDLEGEEITNKNLPFMLEKWALTSPENYLVDSVVDAPAPKVEEAKVSTPEDPKHADVDVPVVDDSTKADPKPEETNADAKDEEVTAPVVYDQDTKAAPKVEETKADPKPEAPKKNNSSKKTTK